MKKRMKDEKISSLTPYPSPTMGEGREKKKP
jgi:hypothetical protein